MRASRVLAALLLAMLVSITTHAEGSPSAELNTEETVGTWGTSYAGQNPIFGWNSDCWPECTATVSVDFLGNTGGGAWFELSGSQEVDPTVNQSVLNSSGTAWLDWHVDILNGTIDRVAVPVVHKTESVSSNWQIAFLHNPGYTDGFGAKWIGDDTDVEAGKHLSIWFKWAPTGTGTVSIRQYPTDTGEFIPEPGSFMALTAGLASLGLAFYRRRNR